MQCGRHLAAFWRVTLPAASNLYVEDAAVFSSKMSVNFSDFMVAYF
jgi:hypothetical protein